MSSGFTEAHVDPVGVWDGEACGTLWPHLGLIWGILVPAPIPSTLEPWKSVEAEHNVLAE